MYLKKEFQQEMASLLFPMTLALRIFFCIDFSDNLEMDKQFLLGNNWKSIGDTQDLKI